MGLHQARTFARAEGCRLLACSDLSVAMRERFAETFPAARTYESAEELLQQDDIGAVVVAVPTGYHAEVATAALEAGKAVMVEKPMARTGDECRRLNEVSERTGRLLMVAQCRRYDAHWKSWGELVTDGRLGRPVLWRDISATTNPSGWYLDDALGGGPLLDGAVHNYDFANWLFGDPVSVVASTVKLDPAITAVDAGSAVVRYGSGDQLAMSWSWSSKGLVLRDVLGTEGYIQFGPGDLKLSPEEAEEHQYCCLTDCNGAQTLIAAPRQPAMYLEQANHVLACIRGEAQCLSPGTEAIKAVAGAEAVLKVGPVGGSAEVSW